MLTTGQAAKVLKLTRWRVWQLIKSRALKAKRVGPMWLIDEKELRRFAKIERRPGRKKKGPMR